MSLSRCATVRLLNRRALKFQSLTLPMAMLRGRSRCVEAITQRDEADGGIERQEMMMTVPCERRFALLVQLAWELQVLRAPCSIGLSFRTEPILYVRGEHGQKDAVLAAQRGERWCLVWRGSELDTEDLHKVALLIAGGAVA